MLEEDAPTNTTGPAVAGTDGNVHWSTRQPRIGEKGKLKKYGIPLSFKAFIRRKRRLMNEEVLDEVLKKVDSKWAIVSKTSGKPLVYYKGEGKPSDEWFKKQEKRIQYFKHKG